jgi:tripartite-type tricarboxylate transporter receptor subunit TctC
MTKKSPLKPTSRRLVLRIAGAALFAAAPTFVSAQESVEEFYTGKTIDMIIGYSPGGTYDRYARLVARFLGEHIPGNPDIIPQNMPGASGRSAAAYIYNVAPKDGTVLGTADQSMAVSQAIGDPSLNLDVSQFAFIGNPVIDNNVLVTWHESGVETIEDARNKPVTVGATGGSTSSQYPTIMNSVLGTQFEIITGYPGGNEVNYAMENGEVDGRGSWNWVGVKSTQPQWVEDGLINVIVQIGLHKDPDLQDVPLLMELAETEEDAAMLRMLSAPTTIGRPIFTTPGVPEERVEALRDAFAAMIEDPAFLEAAAAENLDIRPVLGAELQQIVTDIIATPPAVGQRLAEYIGIE